MEHGAIGIDIGGVLTDRYRNDGTDTSFRGDNYLQTSRVPGSFAGVTVAVEVFGRENTWIVSKCGERIQQHSLDWLEHHDFYDNTGFDPNNIIFTRKRAQKAPIAQDIGLTHFVDDRRDVLLPMIGTVQNPIQLDPREHQAPEGITLAKTWTDVVDQFHPRPQH